MLPPPSHLNKGESGNLEPVQFVYKIQNLPLVSFVLADGECGGPGPVGPVHLHGLTSINVVSELEFKKRSRRFTKTSVIWMWDVAKEMFPRLKPA